ncbi:MAG: SCO family protein, partial [Phycisphaerae bacterium]
TIIGVALFPDVRAIRAAQEAVLAGGGGPRVDPKFTLVRNLPVLYELPAFTLTERSGAALSGRDLAGRVWIADFIFTFCAGPCPMMTQRMGELQASLADLEKLRLVSFSVDPLRDTPDVLTTYAKRFGADAERWLFLTCKDEQIIRDLAIDGFKLLARDATPDELEKGTDAILHSTNFVLVDVLGRVRGFYDALEPASMEQLLSDARKLYDAGGR